MHRPRTGHFVNPGHKDPTTQRMMQSILDQYALCPGILGQALSKSESPVIGCERRNSQCAVDKQVSLCLKKYSFHAFLTITLPRRMASPSCAARRRCLKPGHC